MFTVRTGFAQADQSEGVSTQAPVFTSFSFSVFLSLVTDFVCTLDHSTNGCALAQVFERRQKYACIYIIMYVSDRRETRQLLVTFDSLTLDVEGEALS